MKAAKGNLDPGIASIAEVLRRAEPRPDERLLSKEDLRAAKKNYAERFSRAAATMLANLLRRRFPGITPNSDGSAQEAPARTAKGFKKLDVNYSTPQLGLALGVSVKSINFPPFPKNYSRNDNELRAEATDYHQRQPYAVLIAVLFLPVSACLDAPVRGGKVVGLSSFAKAVKFFRPRTRRLSHKDEVDLFERFFVGLYDATDGNVFFFDVSVPPPKHGLPRAEDRLSLAEMVLAIDKSYRDRNDPPFVWAE